MTLHLSETQIDEVIAETFGRKPRRVAASEAALNIAVARAFNREPDAPSVETQQRVSAAQETLRPHAPWRAVVRWDLYDTLAEAEEHLAELWSSRRGNTREHSRECVAGLLREAWAKGGTTDADRYQATVAELDRYTRHFDRLPPIATGAAQATEVRRSATVTETDVNEAVARAFGREGKR